MNKELEKGGEVQLRSAFEKALASKLRTVQYIVIPNNKGGFTECRNYETFIATFASLEKGVQIRVLKTLDLPPYIADIFADLDHESYVHLFTDPSVREQLADYLGTNRQIFIEASADKPPTSISDLSDLMAFLIDLPSKTGILWLRTLGVNLDNYFPVSERLTDHLEYDKDYQMANLKLIKHFETLSDQEKKQFLVDYFNTLFNPVEQLTVGDFEGLQVVQDNEELSQLVKRYGYSYKRIIFQLSLGAITRIRKKISGDVTAFGFTVSSTSFFKNIIPSNFHMIFTPIDQGGMNVNTLHELKHSVDFNLTRNQRKGKNKVLEEFAALYAEILYPRVIVSITKHKDISGNVTKEEKNSKILQTTLQRITSTIQISYFEQYRSMFKDEKEFKDFILEVGNLLLQISNMISPDEMDKLLMNARDVEELKRAKFELDAKTKSRV